MDRDERIAHLRAVVLFDDIKANHDALACLADAMETRRFKPGASIINEGESGAEFFLLVAGEASVYKSTSDGDSYRVAILKGEQNAFFGEGGLLDSDARSATIKADSECHCLVLKRNSFEAFSTEHPQWALPILRRIARVVMGRLRKSNDDLMLIYNALVAEIRGT